MCWLDALAGPAGLRLRRLDEFHQLYFDLDLMTLHLHFVTHEGRVCCVHLYAVEDG